MRTLRILTGVLGMTAAASLLWLLAGASGPTGPLVSIAHAQVEPTMTPIPIPTSAPTTTPPITPPPATPPAPETPPLTPAPNVPPGPTPSVTPPSISPPPTRTPPFTPSPTPDPSLTPLTPTPTPAATPTPTPTPPPVGRIQGKVTLLGKEGARTAGDAAVVYIDRIVPSSWRMTRPRARPGEPRITMKAKTFDPRIIPVVAGEEIDFPNVDPWFHNVFSLSGKNKFDLGLYKDGATKKWKAAEPGVARVFCNIHPAMTAYLVIVQNPYFARPGADGGYQIGDVPPGNYTLQVWDERGGQASRPVEVRAGAASSVDFELDASGFKELPHKNKFGRDYDTAGY